MKRSVASVTVGPMVLLAGCNAGPFWGRATLCDEQRDQPWAAPGVSASMHLSERWDFARVSQMAEWRAGEHEPVPAFQTVDRCEKFAPRSHDASPVPGQGEFPRRWTYSDTRTIVCISPIVVVSSGVPSQTDLPSGDLEMHGLEGIVPVGSAVLTLPCAYRYGTEVPFCCEVSWFSPSLNVEPTCVTIDAHGNGHIRLPWGELRLEPEGTQWRIRALTRTANSTPQSDADR